MSFRRRLSKEAGQSAVRAALILLLMSTTILQRLGFGSAEFSVSPALIAMYLFLAVALVAGVLVVSTTRVVLYLAAIAAALFSCIVNESHASVSSLLLLIVMYLPFVFLLEPHSLATNDADWTMKQFLNLTWFCAGAGIAQFFAQFAIHGEWLFDFTQLLPASFHGGGTFNTVIPVGSFNKSNGFFFREPSGFSLLMAIALIVESVSQKRPLRLASYALSLLLTYSGTGILALLIGACYPLGRKTVLRLGAVLAVGGLIFALFDDSLNLSFTLGRLSEFSAENSASSGYIRYVAPGRLLGELYSSTPWSAWVGHGSGTISHTVRSYEFHDPTWAKLLFEYGAVGALLFVILFLFALQRPGVPMQVRAVLFWAWLIMGGHLLSPEQNYLTLALIGLLPLEARLSAAKSRMHGRESTDHDAQALARAPIFVPTRTI